MIGDKYYTEALDAQLAGGGRGAFSTHGSHKVTAGGEVRREHVDMSNDKPGEIPGRRKPQVAWAMLVSPGLVGT